MNPTGEGFGNRGLSSLFQVSPSPLAVVGDRTQWQIDSDRVLAHGTLPGGAGGVIYQVPAQTVVEVREWWFCNTDSGEFHAVTLWIVPPGESPASEHIILPAYRVDASEYGIISARTALEAGWSVWGMAEVADVVNYHISGVEAVR